MCRSALLTIGVLLVLPVSAQLLSKHSTLGGINDEYVGQVISTSDGGYLIAGSTGSFGPFASDQAMNAYVIKLNAAGDTVWTRAFGGSGSDGLQSVTATLDGGYVVAGGYNADSLDILLARFSADGTPIWVERVGSSTHGESASKVIALANDEYLVVGSRWELGGDENGNMLAVKITGTGAIDWTSEFGSGAVSHAMDVVLIADYGFMVTGVRIQNSDKDLQLARLDGNGTFLWDKTYQSPGSSEGVAIQHGYDDNIFVVGTNDHALALWMVDPQGEILWEHDYVCDDDFIARGLAFVDGQLFITGSSYDLSGGGFHRILNINSLNEVLMRQSVFNGPLGYSEAASVCDGMLAVGTVLPDGGTQGTEIDIHHTVNLQGPCDDWTPFAVEVTPSIITDSQVMTALPAPTLLVNDLSMEMAHGGHMTTLCTNVGIEALTERVREFDLIPNPASDHVVIHCKTCPADGGSVRVLDTRGRVILRGSMMNDRTVLALGHLTAGIYTVLLETRTSLLRQRLVVQH